MANTTYIDAFIPPGKEDQACINCGICLQKCPVMKLDKETSKAEIKRLLDGDDTRRVLDECTLCYSCNHYCPQGLRPYALIIERMIRKNRSRGAEVPDNIRYLFTIKDKPGYFTDLYKAGTDEDKAILDRWSTPPEPAEDTLFIGCFGRSIPRTIEHSKTLAGLAKFAPRDACCGEIPYRFGDYRTFSETVDHTYAQLVSLKTRRLVCYCGSCSNFMGHIWPDYHGVALPFEVISIWEWLWEKVQSGEIKARRSYDKPVVLVDSCYGSELGEGFFDAVRGLHKAAGMTVVELPNNRFDALCCGFAASVGNNYDQSQAKTVADRRAGQILAAQVPDVSCYCPGCYASVKNYAKSNNLTMHYTLSRILWAFGDDRIPPEKH